MRVSAAALALGLGIAVPCLVAAVAGMVGWAAPLELYLTLAGASFGGGLIMAAALDLALWRAENRSLLRQRDVNTEATRIASLERQARLYASDHPAPPVEAPPDTSHAWQTAIEIFIMAGDSGGFSIRRMQGVVGSDTWAQLTSMLADAGWLANVPGRGYAWAAGYTLARAMLELRAGTLPYPTGPAPVVSPPVNDATLRNAQRRPATVIQGN